MFFQSLQNLVFYTSSTTQSKPVIFKCSAGTCGHYTGQCSHRALKNLTQSFPINKLGHTTCPSFLKIVQK